MKISRFCLCLAALILLSTIPLLSLADFAGCKCYCGKFLRPPCGDAECKRACGWREPSAPPSGPSYNDEAERQRQEAEYQRQLEAERQRQLEIEEKRKKEEADAKRRQEEFERSKREALKSMKGITEGEFGLKGTGTSDDFGLKDAPAGKRTKPKTPVAGKQPKAAAAKPRADKKTVTPPTATKTKDKSDPGMCAATDQKGFCAIPFQKGLRDATECYESSPRVFCMSALQKDRDKCAESYTAGYNAGMMSQKDLMAAASLAGRQDGEEGRKNRSFNHPGAKGPCRIKWIESYNSGYFKGRASRRSN